MSDVALMALVEPVPERPYPAREWLDDVLHTHWPNYGASDGPGDADERDGDGDDTQTPSGEVTEAWAIGSVAGNETLVQSRPGVHNRSVAFIDDLLRPRTRCTLGAYRRTVGSTRPEPIVLNRFQRWVGVAATAQARQLDPTRDLPYDELRSALPPFLDRALGQAGDNAILFFSFLGRLHASGGLSNAFPASDRVRAALSELSETVGKPPWKPPPINLVVTDGRWLALLHGTGHVTRVCAPTAEPTEPHLGPLVSGRRASGSVAFVVAHNHEPARELGTLIPTGVFSVDCENPTEVAR